MAKVIYDVDKFSSNHLCARCALRGNCPLKKVLKESGVVDDTDGKSVYCVYFKKEEPEEA